MQKEEQLVTLRGDFSEARKYVLDHVTEEALILSMIEECSEMIQSSMKRYRAICNDNPTPIAPAKALQMMQEESGDVLMLFDAYGLLPKGITTDNNPKWLRWAQRLGYEGS